MHHDHVGHFVHHIGVYRIVLAGEGDDGRRLCFQVIIKGRQERHVLSGGVILTAHTLLAGQLKTYP